MREKRGGLDLAVALTLWRREMVQLRRHPSRWLGIVGQPLLIGLVLTSGYGPMLGQGRSGSGYATYLWPGMLAMIALFTSIFSTISLIEDRNEGFLQSVVVAPCRPIALVAGKVLGIVTVVLVQVLLFSLTAPIAGIDLALVHPVTLAAAIVLTTVLCANVGMFLAWRLDSAQTYHAIMSVVLLPSWFLSTALFLPPPGGWLPWVMSVNPMSYAVESLRLGLGQGPPLVSEPLLLLGLGALLSTALVLAGVKTMKVRA